MTEKLPEKTSAATPASSGQLVDWRKELLALLDIKSKLIAEKNQLVSATMQSNPEIMDIEKISIWGTAGKMLKGSAGITSFLGIATNLLALIDVQSQIEDLLVRRVFADDAAIKEILKRG